MKPRKLDRTVSHICICIAVISCWMAFSVMGIFYWSEFRDHRQPAEVLCCCMQSSFDFRSGRPLSEAEQFDIADRQAIYSAMQEDLRSEDWFRDSRDVRHCDYVLVVSDGVSLRLYGISGQDRIGDLRTGVYVMLNHSKPLLEKYMASYRERNP